MTPIRRHGLEPHFGGPVATARAPRLGSPSSRGQAVHVEPHGATRHRGSAPERVRSRRRGNSRPMAWMAG